MRYVRSSGARALMVLVAAAATVTSCADAVGDVRPSASAGWSSYGGDAGNANFAYKAPLPSLGVSWSRPTGGPITAPVTISGRSNVTVTANTAAGCNTFAFDYGAGRKVFCRRLDDGIWRNALLVDEYDNSYTGKPGELLSLTGGGGVRWRFSSHGAPLSMKFAAPGTLLMLTHLGQLALIDSQSGNPVTPVVELRPDLASSDSTAGINDCASARSGCPIAAPPAVDTKNQRVFIEMWRKDQPAPQVGAITYHDVDGHPQFHDAWTSTVPDGVIGTPTLSPDSATLYVFGRNGGLYALDATTGKQRWSVDIGGHGFGTMTVSPDGVIIPTGPLGAPLQAVRDRGDHADIAWTRKDLSTVSLSALTSAGTAWTVVRTGSNQALQAMEVSSDSGKTLRTIDLPGAVGFTTGIAVSAAGAIATATNLGQVYFLDAPSS